MDASLLDKVRNGVSDSMDAVGAVYILFAKLLSLGMAGYFIALGLQQMFRPAIKLNWHESLPFVMAVVFLNWHWAKE